MSPMEYFFPAGLIILYTPLIIQYLTDDCMKAFPLLCPKFHNLEYQLKFFVALLLGVLKSSPSPKKQVMIWNNLNCITF